MEMRDFASPNEAMAYVKEVNSEKAKQAKKLDSNNDGKVTELEVHQFKTKIANADIDITPDEIASEFEQAKLLNTKDSFNSSKTPLASKDFLQKASSELKDFAQFSEVAKSVKTEGEYIKLKRSFEADGVITVKELSTLKKAAKIISPDDQAIQNKGIENSVNKFGNPEVMFSFNVDKARFSVKVSDANHVLPSEEISAKMSTPQSSSIVSKTFSDKPTIEFKEAVNNYVSAMKDGKISRPELSKILDASTKIKDPLQRDFMLNTLNLVIKHSNYDGEFIQPKTTAVGKMINADTIDMYEKRAGQAVSHPMLSKIVDPEAKEQMKEFFVRYMTDSVFDATINTHLMESGTVNNGYQMLSNHMGSNLDYVMPDSVIHENMGRCNECQKRVSEIFTQFKDDWTNRNPDKEFKLEEGSVNTTSNWGADHNFNWVGAKGDSKNRLPVDPWQNQRNDSRSIYESADVYKEKHGIKSYNAS